MPQFDLKGATITIYGGTTINSIAVKLGEGNLTYTRTQNVKYLKDRGKLSEAVLGDEEPITISLDAVWENITGDTDVSFEDAITNEGNASGWAGSAPDPCDHYCVDLRLDREMPCAAIKDEQILFRYFRWESLTHDAQAGTIALTGSCNVTKPEVTRT